MTAPAVGITGPDRVDVLAGDVPAWAVTVVNRGDGPAKVTLASAAPGGVINPDTMALDSRARATAAIQCAARACRRDRGEHHRDGDLGVAARRGCDLDFAPAPTRR